MRKKSNRWIKVDLKPYDKEKTVYPTLYFKTQQEVAEFFELPSGQYVNTNGRGSSQSIEINSKSYSIRPVYVYKDLSLEELEGNIKLKTEYKKKILEATNKTNARKELIKKIELGRLSYWEERSARIQLYTDSYIEALQAKYKDAYTEFAIRLDKVQGAVLNTQLDSKAKGKPLTRTQIYRDKRVRLYQEQMSALRREFNGELDAYTRRSLKLAYTDVSNAIKGRGEMFFQFDERKLNKVISEIWCADKRSWSKRIWKVTSDLNTNLTEETIRGILTGQHSSVTAKRIQEITDASYFNAKRLAATELAHIETVAAQDRYKEYGIEEWAISATEDEKTCPVCASHDGEKYSINVTPVPLHPFCRCAMIPVVEF